MADTPKLTDEIGGIGQSVSALFGGLANTEYLSELAWPHNVRVYDKMRRSDAQVQAMLMVMELPIRSTKWYVQPASDSSNAKKAAELVERNLFTGPPMGLTSHFDDVIRYACTMFLYGHSVFEKVFTVRNGELAWKKFATRPQRTIYDFLYDDNGGPAGIKQYKYNNKSTEVVFIPIDKLLVFSHRMEDGDLRGMSVLRAAYKHWKIKDFVYKLINIGIERNLVGTPVMSMPANASKEDKDLAKLMVENLRSAEKGGAIIPNGFVLDIFEGKRGLMEVMPYIEHHDLLMVRSILAQFINLGSSSAGSFALSDDQSELFLMGLNASAKYIAGVFNSYAIPQLVDLNIATDEYPTLEYQPLGKTEKILKTLKELTVGGLIVPDAGLEDFLRERLDLPEKPEVDPNSPIGTPTGIKVEPVIPAPVPATPAQAATQAANTKQATAPAQDAAGTDGAQNAAADNTKASEIDLENPPTKTWARELTPAEGGVAFAQMAEKMDSMESAFRVQGSKIVNKQLDDLSSKVQSMIGAGNVDQISTIGMRYKAELTEFVFSSMIEAVNFGIDQAAKELNQEAPKLDAQQTKEIRANAAVVADNISERAKSRFCFDVLDSLQTGLSIEEAVKGAKENTVTATEGDIDKRAADLLKVIKFKFSE